MKAMHKYLELQGEPHGDTLRAYQAVLEWLATLDDLPAEGKECIHTPLEWAKWIQRLGYGDVLILNHFGPLAFLRGDIRDPELVRIDGLIDTLMKYGFHICGGEYGFSHVKAIA
jgi:hypothetical protein